MRFVVGRADEIRPGGRKIVRVAGRSIGVFNVNGQFHAIRNRCPHQGAALCEGKLWGVLKADAPGSFTYDGSQEILACIQHGWEFSVKTGQSWCDPKRLRVRSYQVSVEDQQDVSPETPVAADDAVKNPMIETVKSPPLGCGPSSNGDAHAPGMVKGPYTVETYPVSVEGGYLYLVVDVVDVAKMAGNDPKQSGPRALDQT
jgi:nitrite reductase/ring-hydroxylating ferredoxin subunit